jgi:hypothetical protein
MPNRLAACKNADRSDLLLNHNALFKFMAGITSRQRFRSLGLFFI